jgi:hypothetical protein
VVLFLLANTHPMTKFLFSGFSPFLAMVFLFFSCTENKISSQSLKVHTLQAAFDRYKEASITHRRFKHAEIVPLIVNRTEAFGTEILGKSVQGREIYQLAYGSGPTKVLLWSQMHGNESTATMALFDLFNFLEGKDDGYDTIRSLLDNKLNIRFIPMVNPDGAELFQRKNALDIDINRDAIHATSPEAALLKAARDNFQPEFGFNLHDQQIYHNASGTGHPATISVLAPAYNQETEVNETRARSMQLIVGMNKLLQQVIPGQVAKYDDAFEPRAFGDNFQKWGTSTILIESGGYPDDTEKQYIRKLNFMVILKALYEIATGNYEHYSLDEYYSIPDNDSKLMDLILKKVSINQEGQIYQVDLGIKRREVEVDSGYYVKGTIEDIGDLSVYFGYQEIDAEGLQFKAGNIWKGSFKSMADLSEEKVFELLRQGYSAVKVSNVSGKELHNLPIAIIKEEGDFTSEHKIGHAADFFLEQDDELIFAVVNGYLIDFKNPSSQKYMQRIF